MYYIIIEALASRAAPLTMIDELLRYKYRDMTFCATREVSSDYVVVSAN